MRQGAHTGARGHAKYVRPARQGRRAHTGVPFGCRRGRGAKHPRGVHVRLENSMSHRTVNLLVFPVESESCGPTEPLLQHSPVAPAGRCHDQHLLWFGLRAGQLPRGPLELGLRRGRDGGAEMEILTLQLCSCSLSCRGGDGAVTAAVGGAGRVEMAADLQAE